MTRIRWTIGDRLTPLHAAQCYALGSRGVDPKLAASLAAPMGEIMARLAAADLDVGMFWNRLMDAALSTEHDVAACERALLAAGCSHLAVESTAASVASQFSDIRLIHGDRFPKLADQLLLRARPIREQWDAYGSALMRQIARQTHESFIPKTVTAILLSPFRGGDGDCDPASHKLWIEAVLTNPSRDVPEVLRLAWLIARIGLITALSGDEKTDDSNLWMSPTHAARVCALALVPITLSAAKELELVPERGLEMTALISEATGLWRTASAGATVATIDRWWKQVELLPTPFPVTLKALDRMLHADTAVDASFYR